MDIKKYKTHIYKRVKNNKKKWPSIKHVTCNKYMHALHWNILNRDYNSTIFGSVENIQHQRR